MIRPLLRGNAEERPGCRVDVVDLHLAVVSCVAVELTQMFKPPVVSSAHEDVFTPPAHRGTLQVIQGRDNNER